MLSNEVIKQFEGRIYSQADKQFLVLSRAQAEALTLEEPHIVLSVEDPDKSEPQMPVNAMRVGHLSIQVDDYDYEHQRFYSDNELTSNGSSPTWFSTQHALSIREFVSAHLQEVSSIVIHCNKGLCRSPAIASALLEWLGSHDHGIKEYFFGYNKLVYDCMQSVVTDYDLAHIRFSIPAK